jgi:RNA polymerase primary sigma factor
MPPQNSCRRNAINYAITNHEKRQQTRKLIEKKNNKSGVTMTIYTMPVEIGEIHFEEKISDQQGIIADDTVSLYLNEMDRVPLLNHKEEISLAKKIEAGRDARQKMLEFVDDREKLEALLRKAEQGKEAREHLIKANIRLVVNIAKKYRRYSTSFLDLIQAGNEGLIRAVDKFDYTKGNRFSTYATWWIRRSVLRHLNEKERTIRLPNYLSTRIRKIHQTRKALTIQLSRTPTMEEIGQVMEMPGDEVQRLLNYSQHTISLDEPVGDDDDTYLQNYIENQNAPNPFIEVRQNLLMDDVLDALSVLTEREAQILIMRYGLGGARQHTLKELGEKFGITRERIRQIQKGAIKKLRNPNIRKKLQHYAYDL